MTLMFVGLIPPEPFPFQKGDLIRHRNFPSRVLFINGINGEEVMVYVKSTDSLAPSPLVKGRIVIEEASVLRAHYVLLDNIPPPPTGLRKPARREIEL